jgi:hypothetical protein
MASTLSIDDSKQSLPSDGNPLIHATSWLSHLFKVWIWAKFLLSLLECRNRLTVPNIFSPAKTSVHICRASFSWTKPLLHGESFEKFRNRVRRTSWTPITQSRESSAHQQHMFSKQEALVAATPRHIDASTSDNVHHYHTNCTKWTEIIFQQKVTVSKTPVFRIFLGWTLILRARRGLNSIFEILGARIWG